mmetsp:Transcript_67744/g.189055  ORF Transcript_67744/g.189055 Transcript_67744/m.189055 type:complete len:212 (-) Transcript_67744:1478-2113(-)
MCGRLGPIETCRTILCARRKHPHAMLYCARMRRGGFLVPILVHVRKSWRVDPRRLHRCDPLRCRGDADPAETLLRGVPGKTSDAGGLRFAHGCGEVTTDGSWVANMHCRHTRRRCRVPDYPSVADARTRKCVVEALHMQLADLGVRRWFAEVLGLLPRIERWAPQRRRDEPGMSQNPGCVRPVRLVLLEELLDEFDHHRVLLRHQMQRRPH